MKVYVDFDGVILDTLSLLFDDNYYKIQNSLNFDKKKYMQEVNWEHLLLKSKVINNSLEILSELQDKITILTKINSLDNEGIAKIKFLRSHGIYSDVILVPYNLKKSDVVNAKNNILIDDTIHNLDDWYLDGGTSIFFNKDNMDKDNWGNVNSKYKKIKDLEYLKDIIKK